MQGRCKAHLLYGLSTSGVIRVVWSGLHRDGEAKIGPERKVVRRPGRLLRRMERNHNGCEFAGGIVGPHERPDRSRMFTGKL